jgi:hypothetical protein
MRTCLARYPPRYLHGTTWTIREVRSWAVDVREDVLGDNRTGKRWSVRARAADGIELTPQEPRTAFAEGEVGNVGPPMQDAVDPKPTQHSLTVTSFSTKGYQTQRGIRRYKNLGQAYQKWPGWDRKWVVANRECRPDSEHCQAFLVHTRAFLVPIPGFSVPVTIPGSLITSFSTFRPADPLLARSCQYRHPGRRQLRP